MGTSSAARGRPSDAKRRGGLPSPGVPAFAVEGQLASPRGSHSACGRTASGGPPPREAIRPHARFFTSRLSAAERAGGLGTSPGTLHRPASKRGRERAAALVALEATSVHDERHELVESRAGCRLTMSCRSRMIGEEADSQLVLNRERRVHAPPRFTRFDRPKCKGGRGL